MIDADHLPHPDHFQEYVIENNAMLNKILHNQACMMMMIGDIYQLVYKKEFGKWPPDSPMNPEVKEREKRADGNFDIYKKVVSEIYERLITKVKKFHNGK